MARRPRTEDGGEPSKNVPWEEAIQTVLSGADGGLHYTDISDRIIDQKLRVNVGATPAKTVAANISTSLRDDPNSPFLKVGRGIYALRAVTEQATKDQGEATAANQAEETGALRAFGMFWQRSAVSWTGAAKLLGRQGAGATNVNFANQVGVYLLHDRERVIYIGRATDTLFTRLKSHTVDRIGGRWDRFSWFGLRAVKDDGALSDSEVPWSQEVVIETMEALLIESLEPPLNRRRGDNFSGIEYIQAIDPQIELAKKRQILSELMEMQR